jgi:iron complex outermembrane recepter protein
VLLLRTLPCALLVAVCCSVPLKAQESAPAYRGEVVDADGSAIVGATVDAVSVRPSAAPELHATTDAAGRFAIRLLPSSGYVLSIGHSGFATLQQTVNADYFPAQPITFHLSVSSTQSVVTVNGRSLVVTEAPTGQTQATVSREDFKSTKAMNIGDVLSLIPGVTFAQGNGPRDVRISVRGSNDRQAWGLRNVQVFEDGFTVTQPDGTARTDLTDPHAYSSIDVVEGPSSALYGNYATGGAINFHTRTGSELQGLEAGADFGSFNYFNDYLAYGKDGNNYQVSGFLSNVRATQATSNSQYNTITANLLAMVAITPTDRLTFKFINNDLDTNLSLRLSLAQYRLNPYQQGCETYTSAAAASGCGTATLYVNGFNGATVSETAAQAGFGRHDRRTIVGARWEHDLSPETTWLTQFVFDDRDINQPTSSFSYRGPYPSFNVMSNVVHHGTRWNTFGGGFFNYENINSYTFNVMPGGRATLGGETQTVFGDQLNTGFHGRAEYTFTPQWTLVAGLGGEYTELRALATNYSYPATGAPTTSRISGNRNYFNAAPEVSVQYQPSTAWRLHARFGTGYGTPQATQLFVTPQGTNGNNTQLKTQNNYGIDIGAAVQLRQNLQATVSGFYEWFHNEQVTQSAGVSLQSYTFNAPASRHRGIDAGLDWHPLPNALSGARARVSYQYDNQIYSDYSEQISSGSFTSVFHRNGNRIPGVQPGFLNGRLLYDQPTGRLRGLGGFVETTWRDNYQLDNANLLKAPGYTLWNLDLHYDPPASHGRLSQLSFYFEIQNLANKTYVASATNITDSLNSSTGVENSAAVLINSTGSVYAGVPRASYGGVRMRF